MFEEVKISYNTNNRFRLTESIKGFLNYHDFDDIRSKNLFMERVENQGIDETIIKYDILFNNSDVIITVIYLDYGSHFIEPSVETFKIILSKKGE